MGRGFIGGECLVGRGAVKAFSYDVISIHCS